MWPATSARPHRRTVPPSDDDQVLYVEPGRCFSPRHPSHVEPLSRPPPPIPRLEQIAFVAGLGAELATGESFVSQFGNHVGSIMLASGLITAGSFAPNIHKMDSYQAGFTRPYTVSPCHFSVQSPALFRIPSSKFTKSQQQLSQQ